MVRSETIQSMIGGIETTLLVNFERSYCPGIPMEVPEFDEIAIHSVELPCGFKFEPRGRLREDIELKIFETLDRYGED